MFSAMRLVSMVIHRRPHCSATYAAVPLPQVGSRTRSPGSVDNKIHRWIILAPVWTTNRGSLPVAVPVQTLCTGFTGKSSANLLYRTPLPSLTIRPFLTATSNFEGGLDQCLPLLG